MSEQTADRERAYDALSDASLGYTPLAFVQDTDMAAAGALPSIPSDATIAVVQAETGDVRWRADGTNPTASVGMMLYEGAERTFVGNLSAVKLIASTTGAIISVHYFKAPA